MKVCVLVGLVLAVVVSTRWRANFYRVDYDEGKTTSWDWARVGASFHESEKFGTLIFE